MVRIFVEGVDGYIGAAVKRLLVADHERLKEEAGEDGEVDKLEIVGSVSYKVTEDSHPPKDVQVVVWRENLEEVCQLALSADKVVLDTHESVMQASAIVKALKAPFDGTKSLVLISSLLTWSNTSVDKVESKEGDEGEDGEEGEAQMTMFTEDEFTRRKPSPSFLLQKTLESQVLALSHDSLSTTVLASGLVYGLENKLFHGFFRDAWLGKELVLPNINEGCKNVVPTIHVQDLARATCSSLMEAPSKQYIVVVDDSHDALADIVSAIDSNVRPHAELTLTDTTNPTEELDPEAEEELNTAWTKFKSIPRVGSGEESDEILLKDHSWTKLQCNLAFDASEGAVSSLIEEWVNKEGMVAGIHKLVKEFRQARDLRPVRVVLTGAPYSGKTMMARKVADEYALPIISAEAATQDLLDSLEATRKERETRLAQWKERRTRERLEQREAAKANREEGDEAGEAEEEEDEEARKEAEEKEDEEDPERLEILRKSAGEKLAERVQLCLEKKGRLSNVLEAKVIRAKMLTPACLNQGYVLDTELAYGMLRRVFGISSILDGLYDPENEEGDDGAVDTDFEDVADEPNSGSDEDGTEDNREESGFVLDVRIAPTAVLSMDAKEETLRSRACVATEQDAITEEEFNAKLEQYKSHNAEDLVATPLSFFERVCGLETLTVPTDQPLVFENEGKEPESKDAGEEKERDEEECKANKNNNDFDEKTFENVMLYIEQKGRPFNYRPTEEDILEMQAIEKAKQLEREEYERRRRISLDNQRREEEAAKLKAMEEHREQVEKHERDLLQSRAEPLQQYLLKHVMPTLSKGLVETCRVKPDDPIDYLAEYLFRHSCENESLCEEKRTDESK